MEKNKEMMQGVQKFDVLSRSPEGYPETVYSLQKIPMMTLRENLMKVTSRKIDDGTNSELYLAYSFDDPKYPRGKHAIRTSIFKGSMVTPKEDGL